jgi:hypothetical protein
MATETQTTSLGEEFAQALSRKDFDEVTRLLHPEVDFRGLTPHAPSGCRSDVLSGSRVLPR